MGESSEITTCPSSKTGTCPYREGDVERRKANRREMDELKVDVSTNTDKIGRLLDFRAIMYGISFLATLFVLGAYTYTFISNDSVDREILSLESKIAAVDKDVRQHGKDIAVINTQYSSLMMQINMLDNRIKGLIDLIKEMHSNDASKKEGSK